MHTTQVKDDKRRKQQECLQCIQSSNSLDLRDLPFHLGGHLIEFLMKSKHIITSVSSRFGITTYTFLISSGFPSITSPSLLRTQLIL